MKDLDFLIFTNTSSCRNSIPLYSWLCLDSMHLRLRPNTDWHDHVPFGKDKIHRTSGYLFDLNFVMKKSNFTFLIKTLPKHLLATFV